HALAVVAADGRGGRQAAHVDVAEPLRASDAEGAIALVVAFADGDGIDVVPDPQQVRRAAARGEGGQARLRDARGLLHVATGLGDLDRAVHELAVAGPAHAVDASAHHRRARTPDLEGRVAVRLQRYAQVAGIVERRRRRRAEAEHGQHVVAFEQARRRVRMHVVHGEARLRARRRVGHRPAHGSSACRVSPEKPTPAWRLRRSPLRNERGSMASEATAYSPRNTRSRRRTRGLSNTSPASIATTAFSTWKTF